ncbi:nucleotidyltransferase family protein [Arvimicrobium flavum]|uniref:nucleotidyltransferase family protein n=1 Tax=Arvimicrobium flavum TaxID=3393320 RepID=UPI00237AABBB|nr:nucleotidyltransferase domain-containing protein [Mesorhizobium shangrilense]
MNRSTAIETLRRNANILRDMGATSLYLFGSTALGEARPESDLDIFIDYDHASRFSLMDLVGIKLFLEENVAAHIDITTRDSLHPMLKSDIERSAIRVF